MLRLLHLFVHKSVLVAKVTSLLIYTQCLLKVQGMSRYLASASFNIHIPEVTRPSRIKMITLPVSPAISTCDSLAGIEDLDAFLEAQGDLSRWPTPPLGKDEVIVSEIALEMSDDEDDRNCQSISTLGKDDSSNHPDFRVASTFAQAASIGVNAGPSDIGLVHRILGRVQLPPDVMALAFNILTALDCPSLPRDSFYTAPSDLMVVSALSLAVSYSSDRPVQPSFWSREVCDCTWTAVRINKTTLQILAALDWNIHKFASPEMLERAAARLHELPVVRSDSVTQLSDVHVSTEKPGLETSPDLKVIIDGTAACWINGQLTPEDDRKIASFECTSDCLATIPRARDDAVSLSQK